MRELDYSSVFRYACYPKKLTQQKNCAYDDFLRTFRSIQMLLFDCASNRKKVRNFFLLLCCKQSIWFLDLQIKMLDTGRYALRVSCLLQLASVTMLTSDDDLLCVFSILVSDLDNLIYLKKT